MRYKAKNIMHDLFHQFMEFPDCLPGNWYSRVAEISAQEKAVIIGDYIAGMTDRFAIDEHRRIFDPSVLMGKTS